MKLKTTELQGEALDRMVAKREVGDAINEIDDPHFYSTDWALGGPIIERERISIEDCQDGAGLYWEATRIEPPAVSEARGPTPLIAAMRCYVASVFGEEVEIPDELMKMVREVGRT
jgi:hypothetical protein